MTKSFSHTLKEHSLQLKRGATSTLQINVGLLCNLVCKHCHLDCGPSRREVMDRKTMDDVIAFAARNSFELADITGGAPEMVDDLVYLIDNLRPLVDRMILRSNLTLLLDDQYRHILDSLIKNKVAIVASFPSINQGQTNSQRGDGVWQKSIESLQNLNELGYGIPDSELELILVSNPTGAFMPTDQCIAEKKFKTDLAQKWNIKFTHLFTFANVPLGRFKKWLISSGNYDKYMEKLSGNFNGSTVTDLMCRTLISVSWNGYLYDCDFNQAADLPYGVSPTHVNQVDKLPEDTTIVTENHCYGCTAGAGFT